jgi:fructokinase
MDVSHLQIDEAHPTGTVAVDASDPQSPKYAIAEDVAWDHLRFDDKLEALAGQADAVCFGTLAQRTTANQEVIHRFLNAATGAVIIFDVNLRKSPHPEALLARSLRAASVAKMNEGEAGTLSQLLRLPSGLADFAAGVRDRYGVQVLCVTHGGEGCSLYSPKEHHRLPGLRVHVVDAVGAGDAFTAGLVTGLIWGWPLEACGTLANQMGALVAGRAGAVPEIDAEARALVQSMNSIGG